MQLFFNKKNFKLAQIDNLGEASLLPCLAFGQYQLHFASDVSGVQPPVSNAKGHAVGIRYG